MKADLVTYLKTDAALAAIVGTRIHPDVLPQKEQLPALVYQIIYTDRGSTLKNTDGLPVAHVQLTAYTNLVSEAESIKERIRNLFDGFSGSMGDTIVRKAKLANDLDGPPQRRNAATEDTARQRIFEIEIWFNESIPTF